MRARHKQYIADNGLDSICGRIYISRQGINCQGGGLKCHTQQYVSWVGSQPEFQGLFHTLWPADGPMFPKLRLKVKPNLISLAGTCAGALRASCSIACLMRCAQVATAHLPQVPEPATAAAAATEQNQPGADFRMFQPYQVVLVFHCCHCCPFTAAPCLLPGGMEAIPCTDPDMRATPLDPAAWRDKLAEADAVNTAVEAGREQPVGRSTAMHAVCASRGLGCATPRAVRGQWPDILLQWFGGVFLPDVAFRCGKLHWIAYFSGHGIHAYVDHVGVLL